MTGGCALQGENANSAIVTDSAEMLRAAGIEDNYIELVTYGLTGLLDDYAGLMGEGTEVSYRLRKKLTRIEIRIQIAGEQYDPFTNGEEALKRKAEKLAELNLNADIASVSYKYTAGCNTVTVSVPLTERKKPFYRKPIFLSLVLGVACGIVCLYLPESANSFIIDSIASPVKSLILSVISGIMGPVIFISMVTSIVALDSINELTNLVFRIVRRFIWIILFLMAVSIVVSGFFFQNFGTGSISFSADELIELILSIVPTNLIEPFLEGVIPQIVVLGFLMGAALLLLGDRVAGLKELLIQLNKWIMEFMKIVLTIVPLIPFLSLVTIIGSGNASDLLEGWKFILAAYIVFTIGPIAKAVKTSIVTGMRIRDIWKKIRSIVGLSFTTSSNATAMKKIYEVADRDLSIKPEFTSIWIPMCMAMLSIKTTVYLILGTLMAAQMSGVGITASFMFVLILVTLELSLASPGAAACWTIMFEVLGMSTDYVGLFSVYRAFTENYCTAGTMAYSMFELLEASHKLGGRKEDSDTGKSEMIKEEV